MFETGDKAFHRLTRQLGFRFLSPANLAFGALPFTGLRVAAELLTLTWQDVQFQRSQLTVQSAFAKAGETRNVPLNSRIREVLLRLKSKSRSLYIFAKPNGLPYRSMDKLLSKACEDAGLSGTGISLHTLRHTFASRLVMSGTDFRTIQILGSWRDLSLVQRYSHLSPGHCQQAFERIAEEFPAKFPPMQETRAVVQLAERRVSM